MRRAWPLLLWIVTGGAPPAVAQSSPYIALDDPLLPLAEWLIGRGDIRDPSPMLRPFRRADLLAALDAATLVPGSPAAAVAERLRRAYRDSAGDGAWEVAARAGTQGFTSARREQLRPAGEGGMRGYAELGLAARAGSVVAVTRGAIENRLKLDPDWPGDPSQDASSLPARFIDAYLSAQWRWVHLTFGQRDRNWGADGVPGIGLSAVGYPRSDLQFDLVTRSMRFSAVGARLRAAVALDGEPVGRYFAAHRLAIAPHPSLHLAVWETAVITDRFDQIDADFFNPLTLLSMTTRFGWGDDRNALLGAEVAWRAGGVRLELQAGLDDYNPGGTNPYPNRWALALGVSGRAGARAGWQARYATATSLAFRTQDPAENLLDGGVGIGWDFADHELWVGRVSSPVGGSWLAGVEVQHLRQGEGDPRAPWPTPAEAADLPTRFIGRIGTTTRLGATLTGQAGPFGLAGAAAWQRRSAADEVTGRFEARFTATLALTRGGPLQ